MRHPMIRMAMPARQLPFIDITYHMNLILFCYSLRVKSLDPGNRQVPRFG